MPDYHHVRLTAASVHKHSQLLMRRFRGEKAKENGIANNISFR